MRRSPVAVSLLVVPAALANVVQWDLEKHDYVPRLRHRTLPTVQESLVYAEQTGAYYATVKIGTPGQEFTLQVDTGSSDTWVPSSSAPLCAVNKTSCTRGTFDSSKSSSFRNIGRDEFLIGYADESHSEGDFFQDSFDIDGLSISNFTMGLAKNTTVTHGLIGIGYANQEVSVSNSTPIGQYPNLPIALQRAGHINTVAYSIWLNDIRSKQGSILFGGIDKKKFTGDLMRIDVLPQDGTVSNFTALTVALTSIEAVSSSGSDWLTISDADVLSTVLDSGSTASRLPNEIAQQIWLEAGAEFSGAIGQAIIPCSFSKNKGYFSFGFAGPNGPRINVTMNELVLPSPPGDNTRFTSGVHKGQLACAFGIQNATVFDASILGDTFLRSAYVVYDLQNNQIALAPSKFNATDSDIAAFPSLGAPIPSARVVPSQNVTWVQPPTPTKSGLQASKGFQDNGGQNTSQAGAALVPVLGLGAALATQALMYALA
ncbi:hypothetical protein PWT90_10879 [Aphanocladium album]|nr:hypothetical protein PWT90_10879 [Aphanocladium album]